MWRYTGISDLLNLIKGTVVSTGAIMLSILLLYRFEGYPRSIFVIDFVLALLFIAGFRLAIRIFLQNGATFPQDAFAAFPFLKSQREGKNVSRMFIIGAGDAGEKMVRELRGNPRLNYQISGFLDDDPRKRGMHIHGVPILGNIEQLAELAHQHEIDEILIAISNISGKEMRRIVDHCKESGKKYRTIPGIGELIDGRVSLKAIRDVAFEDLLGRKPVDLEMDKIGEYLQNKPVLITGAGGSIGSELCHQISRFRPRPLILLDSTENNLYQIENELKRDYKELHYVPILGSVLNSNLLRRIFARHRPAVIFHAAAYKHVPITELNPWEAVMTNIQGTRNLLTVCREFPVERFVFVSSDKAVRPANVMGGTKRVAELLVQATGKSARHATVA